MADHDQPPAPPAATDIPAPAPSTSSPAPAPVAELEAAGAPAPVAEPAEDLLPTIRDHAERTGLTRTQTDALIARLHGEHDEDGKRRFAHGASLNTRMSDEDFDAAADVAFHGRI